MNPFQFKIPGRQKKCSLCSAKFEDGSAIYSIVYGSEEEPKRKDFCKLCFDEEKLSEDIWGHWHTILKKEKQNLSPDQKAMELFKEAYKEDNPEYLLFIAQYLKRKKQLVMRPEIKKDETLFFEDPKTSEVYGIPKKEIAPDKLGQFKHLFIQNLESEE